MANSVRYSTLLTYSGVSQVVGQFKDQNLPSRTAGCWSTEESSVEIYLWNLASTVNVWGGLQVIVCAILKHIGGASSSSSDGKTGGMGTVVLGINDLPFSWYLRICTQDG